MSAASRWPSIQFLLRYYRLLSLTKVEHIMRGRPTRVRSSVGVLRPSARSQSARARRYKGSAAP
jgi:hypothetical protein